MEMLTFHLHLLQRRFTTCETMFYNLSRVTLTLFNDPQRSSGWSRGASSFLETLRLIVKVVGHHSRLFALLWPLTALQHKRSRASVFQDPGQIHSQQLWFFSTLRVFPQQQHGSTWGTGTMSWFYLDQFSVNKLKSENDSCHFGKLLTIMSRYAPPCPLCQFSSCLYVTVQAVQDSQELDSDSHHDWAETLVGTSLGVSWHMWGKLWARDS